MDVRGCHEVSASLLLKLPLPNIRILELGVFSDASQDGLAKLLHKVRWHFALSQVLANRLLGIGESSAVRALDS